MLIPQCTICAYIPTYILIGKGELKVFQKGGTKMGGITLKGGINTVCELCPKNGGLYKQIKRTGFITQSGVIFLHGSNV